MPELIPAHINLDDKGDPFAVDYGDCYFSRNGGLAETRYVFLEGNHLPQRWHAKEHFTILETGFGTGLNFLATWYEWAKDANRCQTLHFISIEKHPIPASTLKALLQWDELKPLATDLLQKYPALISGIHHLLLAQGRVRLTLYFEDIAKALPELTTKVDTFFLDGFAPDRNETMWSPEVLKHLAQLAKPQATLATFTAASNVRRHLQEAGFTVVKRKGFGTKREMITAFIENPPEIKNSTPYFIRSTSTYSSKTTTVIGAGLAGCQIAHALAKRGWQVTLIERHERIATEASGNPAGVVSPKMTAHWSWGEAFYRQAFIFATQQLQQCADELTDHWNPCGVLQLNHNQPEFKRWQAIQERRLDSNFIQTLEANEASQVAGIALTQGSSYFPQGGYLKPSTLCKVLLQHPNIIVKTHTEALELNRSGEEWQVCTGTQVVESSSAVILTSGQAISQFLNPKYFPVQTVWGQTSRATATPESTKLNCVLGHEGYVTPDFQGEHIFGATFEYSTDDFNLKLQSDETNWQELQHHLPQLAQVLGTYSSGHAAMRVSSPDRFPYVGAVADVDFYLKAYADIQHGRHWQTYPDAQYQKGLYVLTGLAARGLTTSALCAEVLAAEMNNEPIPLQNTLQQSLHSARFFIRALKRGELVLS